MKCLLCLQNRKSSCFSIKQAILSCEFQIPKISVFFHSFQFTRIFAGGVIQNCIFKVLNHTFALHYVGMRSNVNTVGILIIGKQLFANNKVVTLGVSDMMLSATFNNISVISWRSVLFGEDIGVPGESHRPIASH